MDCSPPGSSVHGISQQEYWSGLPFPPAGDLPDPGIEPTSLCVFCTGRGFFTTEPPGNPPLLLGLPVADCKATSHSLRLSYPRGCPAPTPLLPMSPGLMPTPGRRGAPFLLPRLVANVGSLSPHCPPPAWAQIPRAGLPVHPPCSHLPY